MKNLVSKLRNKRAPEPTTQSLQKESSRRSFKAKEKTKKTRNPRDFKTSVLSRANLHLHKFEAIKVVTILPHTPQMKLAQPRP